MKTTCEMKNTLDKINSGLSTAEEKLMDMYIQQQKLSKKKKTERKKGLKNEKETSELWDNSK